MWRLGDVITNFSLIFKANTDSRIRGFPGVIPPNAALTLQVLPNPDLEALKLTPEPSDVELKGINNKKI
jgi:hypothetical protein